MGRKAETVLTAFIIGLLATCVTGLAGVLIYALISAPAIVGYIIAGLIGVTLLGFALLKIEEWYGSWKSDGFLNSKPAKDPEATPYKSHFENPTLSLLDELERKYSMSTLAFINYHITTRLSHAQPIIDPLDMVTWIGLINSLPEVLSYKPLDEEGRKRMAQALQKAIDMMEDMEDKI